MRRLSTIFRNSVVLIEVSVVTFLVGSCQPSEYSTLEEISDRRYQIDPAAATISVSNRDGSIRIYGAGGDLREVRVETLKKPTRSNG